jgi:TolB-like protein/Flp pilus assembly protein TadD
LGEGFPKRELQSRNLPSVAVLPFQDLSPKQDQDYFCEGLAEEIINALTLLQSIRVVARASAFVFKGRQVDIHEIGRRLNVETLLEGSVRKDGDRLQISAQLVNVSDGCHLWSNQYSGVMEDVFTIQENITVSIVNNVRATVFDSKSETITKRHTENIEAYNLYLKGRYLWNMGTRDDIEKAIEYFERVIAIDPNYAPAYVGLFESYCFLYSFVCSTSIDLYQKAKMSAQNAIEIDPSLAESHSAMGSIKLWEWDWKAAKKYLHKATELNPQSTSAHYYYSFYFMAIGRLEDAINEMKKTLDVDPLSRSAHALLGVWYIRLRRLEKARIHLRYALELQMDSPQTRASLGQTYILASEYETGITELEKAARLGKNSALTLSALGWGYAISGRRQEALSMLEELKSAQGRESISPYLIAKVYCGLGNKDQAFYWLEKALNEHDVHIIRIKTDETLDDLRSDPRYNIILRRLKLE